MEKLIIAGKEFNSRLFLGTGKFSSNQLMEDSILASGCEMVTVAMKRVDLDDKEDDMFIRISGFYRILRAFAMRKRLFLPLRWHARLLVQIG